MSAVNRTVLFALLLALLPIGFAEAQSRRERPWPEASASTEAKRAFLIERFLSTLPDDQFLASERKLSTMNAEQVDALVAHFRRQYEAYGSELAVARAHLAQAEEYRNDLSRSVEAAGGGYGGGAGNAVGGGGNGVGYRPVVTWLPEGASLGVGAVVSPDRRYVRINAQPFFSSVGPVQTFQFHSGPSYGYGAPNFYFVPGYGYYYNPTPTYYQAGGYSPQPRGGSGVRRVQPAAPNQGRLNRGNR